MWGTGAHITVHIPEAVTEREGTAGGTRPARAECG